MQILQEESELDEIVKLVGIDALSPTDRLTLEAAKSIREDYLHQDAFSDVDTYTSTVKQYHMMRLLLQFHSEGLKAVAAGADINEIFKMPVRERIGRFKYVPEDKVTQLYQEILSQLNKELTALQAKEVD
jgi:V/A-type H+-transporting ATPase subunit A